MRAMDGMSLLVTGATGQVALPLVCSLAKSNEVWAAARFSSAEARERLEAAGARCVPLDLAGDDLDALPDRVDHVLNFAVSRSNDFDADLRTNAEALGLLMQRYQDAHSVLHCSSTAVYQPKGRDPHKETDPLGDNHRVMFPTYSIVKIAAEAVARTCARLYQLPTVIARLNVPYGGNGGWPFFHLLMMKQGMAIPVHADGSVYNPIHEDDITAMLPAMLAAASVPATIVNWGGDEAVSIEEWCTYLGEIAGAEPRFEPTDATLESVTVDLSKMHELVGHTHVHWKDGLRAMAEAHI